MIVRGSSALVCAALPSLEAPSSLHLESPRWGGRTARLARMDRLCALALVAADAALLDAGETPETLPADRTGIVLGTAYGCHATNQAYDDGARAGAPSPRLFAYTLPSSAVGEISIHAGLTGPASTVVGGLTAGLDALREAQRHLHAGRADRMLVVSADVVTPMLDRLREGAAPTRDVACALYVERLDARMRTSFCAGDPERAARRCLEAVGTMDVRESWAPQRLSIALPGTRHALDESLLAAAPLVALRSSAGSVLVLATDPSGMASAIVVSA